ncbi:hypothetical protein KFE25_004679 [Diacronema lutheri]|uniref:PHD and RING finger domain-containing protein 1 n=1 Tax=Diacronema lutheri TaxID=2081491 RepID=A0A8J5XEY5_DIALT|nr:hypothetical protein KFE25_004679 [Diacronema lutheri]
MASPARRLFRTPRRLPKESEDEDEDEARTAAPPASCPELDPREPRASLVSAAPREGNARAATLRHGATPPGSYDGREATIIAEAAAAPAATASPSAQCEREPERDGDSDGDGDGDGEEEDAPTCGICLQQITARGVLDCCAHLFCTECIVRWARCATNRCPFCHARVTAVTEALSGRVHTLLDREQRTAPANDATWWLDEQAAFVDADAGGGAVTRAHEARHGATAGQALAARLSAWDAHRRRLAAAHAHASPWQIAISLWQMRGLGAGGTELAHARGVAGAPLDADGGGAPASDAPRPGGDGACVACADGGLLLLCDRCDDAWHLNCLPHPLRAVPPGEWYCPWCAELRAQHAADALSRARAPSAAAGRFRIPRTRRAASASAGGAAEAADGSARARAVDQGCRA